MGKCLLSCIMFLLISGMSYAEVQNGYLWQQFSHDQKMIYVMGYVEGIGYLNLEIRHQMDVLTELNDKETESDQSLFEYAHDMKDYYIKNYHYFNIPYQQIVEGLDKVYSDFENKTIKINNAFWLVKFMLEGRSEDEIHKSMIYIRKID